MMKTLDHVAVNVQDVEAMVRFYSEVLRLKPERLELYRNGEAPFPSVRIDADTIIDFFPPEMQGEPGPLGPAVRLNHTCLAMGKAEWDALRARLQENGVPEEVGPVPRWGAHGSGISVYFRDPDGNLLEARYYPAGERGDAGGLTS